MELHSHRNAFSASVSPRVSCVSTSEASREAGSWSAARQLRNTVDIVGRAPASLESMNRMTPLSAPQDLCSAVRTLSSSHGACLVPRIISNTCTYTLPIATEAIDYGPDRFAASNEAYAPCETHPHQWVVMASVGIYVPSTQTISVAARLGCCGISQVSGAQVIYRVTCKYRVRTSS